VAAGAHEVEIAANLNNFAGWRSRWRLRIGRRNSGEGHDHNRNKTSNQCATPTNHGDAVDSVPRISRSPASGILIDIRVIPRAGRSGLAGTRDGAILVRLKAPPVDGAANAELVDLLAELLGVARRDVEIVSGVRGRLKRVRVTGITADAVAERLA